MEGYANANFSASRTSELEILMKTVLVIADLQ